MTDNSLPPPQLPARPGLQSRLEESFRQHRLRWLAGAGAAVVVILAVAAGVAPDEDPAPSQQMTPVEAACSMLEDGDTPQQAYDAMVILLEDLDYTFPDAEAAARESVDRAVARGC